MSGESTASVHEESPPTWHRPREPAATWARMVLGGLVFMAFVSGKQRRVRAEIAEVLKARFETCPA